MAVIVVAEDDPHGRELLVRALERAGHTVFAAGNGLDALDIVLRHGPDLLVTDHMMPLMTGATLCAQLRADPRTREIPVILVTGAVDPTALRREVPYAVASLGKPFRPNSIVQLSEIALRPRVPALPS